MLNINVIISATVFALLGIVILLIAFWIVERITPENLWKEIIEKQNKALAIMAAGFMIAIALIIASAIH